MHAYAAGWHRRSARVERAPSSDAIGKDASLPAVSHSAISMAESAYTTGPVPPWIWKRGNISIINRDRSETCGRWNAGATSVVKAALVVWQATYPHPSPQPSTSASVQTRTTESPLKSNSSRQNRRCCSHVEGHTNEVELDSSDLLSRASSMLSAVDGDLPVAFERLRFLGLGEGHKRHDGSGGNAGLLTSASAKVPN